MGHDHNVVSKKDLVLQRIETGRCQIRLGKISVYFLRHSTGISSGFKVMPVDQSHMVYYGTIMNRLQLTDDCAVHRQTHKGVVCY